VRRGGHDDLGEPSRSSPGKCQRRTRVRSKCQSVALTYFWPLALSWHVHDHPWSRARSSPSRRYPAVARQRASHSPRRRSQNACVKRGFSSRRGGDRGKGRLRSSNSRGLRECNGDVIRPFFQKFKSSSSKPTLTTLSTSICDNNYTSTRSNS
jgi:hypothetical protein